MFLTQHSYITVVVLVLLTCLPICLLSGCGAKKAQLANTTKPVQETDNTSEEPIVIHEGKTYQGDRIGDIKVTGEGKIVTDKETITAGEDEKIKVTPKSD